MLRWESGRALGGTLISMFEIITGHLGRCLIQIKQIAASQHKRIQLHINNKLYLGAEPFLVRCMDEMGRPKRSSGVSGMCPREQGMNARELDRVCKRRRLDGTADRAHGFPHGAVAGRGSDEAL